MARFALAIAAGAIVMLAGCVSRVPMDERAASPVAITLDADACRMVTTLNEPRAIEGVRSIVADATIGLYKREVSLSAAEPFALHALPSPDGMVVSFGTMPDPASAWSFFWFGVDCRSFAAGFFESDRAASEGRSIRLSDGALSVPMHASVLGFTAPAVGRARGIALVLSGLPGNDYSGTLAREMTERGWLVVRIEGFAGQGPDEAVWRRAKGIEIETDARTLADEFDRSQCRIASASAAALRVMLDADPELAGLPVAVVGTSAGGLATPATVQKLRDSLGIEPEAVAIIASGADLFTILRRGSLIKFSIFDADGRRADRATMDRYAEIYRETSMLDPYHLAPTLDPKRTLVVHAKFDAVVPASSGMLLWERAGRPERWDFPGGHFGLFVTLGWLADDIAEWMTTAATR